MHASILGAKEIARDKLLLENQMDVKGDTLLKEWLKRKVRNKLIVEKIKLFTK